MLIPLHITKLTIFHLWKTMVVVCLPPTSPFQHSTGIINVDLNSVYAVLCQLHLNSLAPCILQQNILSESFTSFPRELWALFLHIFFHAYSQVLDFFFNGRKVLPWKNGKLTIDIIILLNINSKNVLVLILPKALMEWLHHSLVLDNDMYVYVSNTLI